MDNWVDIVSKVGIPVGLLLLIGYVFVKYIWPFYTKQVEDGKTDRRAEIEAARADRKEEIAKFMETIRSRDILMAEIQERNLKALDAVAAEMRGLREDVRNHKNGN